MSLYPYPLRVDLHPRAAYTHSRPPGTPTYTWQAPSSGRFHITFASLMDCERCARPGPADLDVADLSEDPAIAAQLAAIDPAALAAELQELGAWSDTELADHRQNLQRLLWVAACDVSEQPLTYINPGAAP
jgi:hypothetical protein